MRKLKATDLFAVSKIIKTIGVDDIINCFSSKEIKDLAKTMSEGDKKYTDGDVREVGAVIVKNICTLIFDKLDLIENDLMKFISSVTGLSIKEVEDLPLNEFAEVVVHMINNPDFMDFINVVLKSFN